MYGVVEKSEVADLRPQFCQFLADIRFFFAGRFVGKFAVNRLITNPTKGICCLTTFSNITVSKQAISDKLLGSVRNYIFKV